MTPRWSLAAALVAVSSLTIACGDGNPDDERASTPPRVDAGRTAYEATCAACHGGDLRGTSTGPPFLHVIYAPNHHPDDSFRAAVARGVPPHHWNFGPMPAQPSVSADEVDAIIAYVRERQRQAGITVDPSH